MAAGSYQQVQLWNVADHAAGKTLAGHAGPVRCLAWSADGKRLAAGGGKPGVAGEVKVWNLEEASPTPVATMNEHKDVVEGVAFAGTGQALVTAGEDEKALATDLQTSKPLAAMTDHTNRVVSVSVSQNGKWVATGSLDKTVKIWSGADFKPLANLDQNGGQVYSVVFLPPGDQLAAAGEDGNVRIYRLSESRTGKLVGVNGQVVRTFNGNRTPLFALAVSKKGDLLAAAGEDGAVNLYNVNGGRKATLKECPDAVYALAFSPAGSLLAAGSRDGKVRLWTTTDGKLASELEPMMAANERK